MTKLNNGVLGLLMTVSTAIIGSAQPKGPTITVKGEAVDLWCYMKGGDRGPAKKIVLQSAQKLEIRSA